MKGREVQDHGTIELRSYPTCPQCGAPWDNDHIDGGHCPGRPSGCSCKCDLGLHRPPTGMHRAWCLPSERHRSNTTCSCRYVHVKKEES